MATRMFDRGPAALPDPHARVATIVARHGDLLLRVARQFSLCADDAHDAVQRALEIYMRRVDSLDPATELAWLKVVVIRLFVQPRVAGASPCARTRQSRAGDAEFDIYFSAATRSVIPTSARASVLCGW